MENQTLGESVTVPGNWLPLGGAVIRNTGQRRTELAQPGPSREAPQKRQLLYLSFRDLSEHSCPLALGPNQESLPHGWVASPETCFSHWMLRQRVTVGGVLAVPFCSAGPLQDFRSPDVLGSVPETPHGECGFRASLHQGHPASVPGPQPGLCIWSSASTPRSLHPASCLTGRVHLLPSSGESLSHKSGEAFPY